MAVSAVFVRSDRKDVANYNTFTMTNTCTFAKDTALIAVVVSQSTGEIPPTPTLSGAGYTWTQLADFRPNDTDIKITAFHAVSTSTQIGQVLTVNWSSSIIDASTIQITQFNNTNLGNNAGDTFRQPTTKYQANVNSFSITLGAFADTLNGTFYACSGGGSPTFSAGSGFSALNTTASGYPRGFSEFRATNDTVADASSSININSLQFACEIVHAPVVRWSKGRGNQSIKRSSLF